LGGSYPSLTRIDVDAGVGRVLLDMVGRYPALEKIDLDAGTGDIKVDLTGEWTRDAWITLDTGIGKTSLRLPKDVGVRVDVDTGIGKISRVGMKTDGKVFVNDAYGTSKVTLNIRARSGTGDIVLDLEK
jgi:predicted membrane protein